MQHTSHQQYHKRLNNTLNLRQSEFNTAKKRKLNYEEKKPNANLNMPYKKQKIVKYYVTCCSDCFYKKHLIYQ